MGKNKGNNAAEAKSAAVAAAMKTRSPWLSAKTKKKLVKWSLLLVGPVALAAAVAFLGAPPPELDQQQANPAAAAAAQNQHNAAAADAPFSDEAPPMDEWENPNDCKAWAGGGECKNNPEFMLKNCAGSCAALDFARQKYNRRCPKPSNYTEALPAGKMASIFSRIMEDFKELEPEEISSDPPVILFHKFLRDSEAEAFVKHGRGRYEKSLGVGMKADGTMGDVATEIRTSSHGWCQHPACLNDPEVQRVTGRVADITQTPPENAEYAQLVYYNGDGQQFYRRHSDYIEGDEHKLPGVRIALQLTTARPSSSHTTSLCIDRCASSRSSRTSTMCLKVAAPHSPICQLGRSPSSQRRARRSFGRRSWRTSRTRRTIGRTTRRCR